MAAPNKTLALAVIEDVRKLLQEHVLEAERGEYLLASARWQLRHHMPLNEILSLENDEPCAACAVGSLFLGFLAQQIKATGDSKNYTTAITNNQLDQSVGRVMFKELEAVFDRKTLILAELAFEGYTPHPSDAKEGVTVDDGDRARRFCEGLSDDSDRLRKILDNMEQNEGDFVP